MSQTYKIHAVELGSMQNFIYFISDITTSRTAVIDPAWDAKAILNTAKQQGFTISDILLTHTHHDHINAVGEILQKTDAQLHILKAEAEFWQNSEFNPTLHHGGDKIQLGESEINLLHTPGHTPGSCCYHVGNDLIAGDTMFVFGCGRCDLRGGDPEVLFDTLKKLSKSLPSDTIIRPGHNYAVKESCTLQEQIVGNPFMLIDKKEDFVRYRMGLHGQTRQSPYQAVDKEELLKILSK